MTFFTELGIVIVALLWYLILFEIGIDKAIKESAEDDAPYFGFFLAGLVISFLFTIWIGYFVFVCNIHM